MRTRLKLCILIVVLVSCISFAAGDNPNLLRNSSFEAGRYGWVFDAKPLDGSFEVVRSDDAVDGSYVARIEAGRQCAKACLGGQWVAMDEGSDYVFGVSLRGDATDTPVRLSVWSWADASGKWNQKTEAALTVKVTDKWQRFAVAANLEKARAGKYQVLIELSKPGVIYADAASLTKGGAGADCAAIEIGVDLSQEGGLYDVSQTPQINIRVYSPFDKPQAAALDYVVTDIEDKPVLKGGQSLTLEPQATIEKRITLPLEKKGYYRFTANIAGAGDFKQSCTLAFAIIEKNTQPPAADSPFAVDMASYNLEIQLERALQLGVANVRVHESLNWAQIEKRRGEYDWPKSAAYQYYKDKGLGVLVYVDAPWQGMPQWAKDLDEKRQLRAYGEFCAKCVEHYKGVIDNFEAINEPWSHIGEDEFLDILKPVYRQSKQADAGAVIAAVTGYHGPQIDFVRKVIDAGSLDYMDVFTVHPYPRPQRPEPVLGDVLKQSGGWLENAGWKKPVWITEMGWTTVGQEYLPTRIPRPDARNNTALEQAQYLVRSNILSLANGVDRVYWFYYSGSRLFFYSYDMFECDSGASVMKSVAVYSAMTSRLGGYSFEKKLCEGEGGVYAYMFTDGKRHQIAAWTTGAASTLLLEGTGGAFKVYDMLGNEIPTGGKDLTAVAIDGSPVYIESSAGDFADVQAASAMDVKILAAAGKTVMQVELKNIWKKAADFNIRLNLPESVMAKILSRTCKLDAGGSRRLTFALDVVSQSDAVADDVAVISEATLEGGQTYHFAVTEQLLWTKPLPICSGGIWIEAEKPYAVNFKPEPIWQPNLLRSYGGDNLRCRIFGKPARPKEYIAEYEFTVAKDGQYWLLIACSPFDKDDNLSWSIDGGEFVTNKTAKQLGKPWVYSAHPNIWWRFTNVWNDMGLVQLSPGKHRLILKLAAGASSDYNYMTVDAICVADEKSKAEFESVLNSLK